MTNAIRAFGTIFGIGDAATPTEAFTAAAEVTGLSGPGVSTDTLDASNMSSPGAFREYIAGLIDAGELTVEINYVPADPTHGVGIGGLLIRATNGTVNNYELTFPDSTKWSFSAICTGFEPSAPVDDKLTASVSFKLTGQPSFS